MNDLANDIAELGTALTGDPSAGPSPPAIAVNVDGPSRDLNPVVREEAYRIAGEALRSFGSCRRPATSGCQVCAPRSSAVNSTSAASSGVGTEIELRVPGAIAYRRSTRRSAWARLVRPG